MPDQDLIGGLIETYRTLNHSVRSVPEQRLRQSAGGTAVRDVMRRIRDDELRFSQALKEQVTGVPMPDIFGEDELPTLGTETAEDTTAMLIAQFGTARESTLAMLRDLPDSDWDSMDTGGKSVRARVTELLSNDRRQLERITGLIGAG
ncbi:MAG: hypothetical protein IT336_12015 [Thermomicrobiales bacterium]|nr:hypothetical protein [Thermomicrobiales bacterium]